MSIYTSLQGYSILIKYTMKIYSMKKHVPILGMDGNVLLTSVQSSCVTAFICIKIKIPLVRPLW